MKTDEAWPPERLVHLLDGLAELLPWRKQWHDDLDPATGERLGTWFAGFVADEARELGTTVEALGAWRPAAGAGRRPRPRGLVYVLRSTSTARADPPPGRARHGGRRSLRSRRF